MKVDKQMCLFVVVCNISSTRCYIHESLGNILAENQNCDDVPLKSIEETVMCPVKVDHVRQF